MELNERRLENGIWHLSVSGEMDLYNADEYKRAMDRLFSDGGAGVVADLDELSYIDSSGIGALLYAVSQSRSRRQGLCFVNVTGSVRKVIELTSLLGFLPIEDTLDDAVSRLLT